LPQQDRLITVVDDSYNANPDSVLAAIDVLAELPAPRLLVLGDMGEVGTQGPAFHAEVGRYARDQHIDQVLALGELSRHTVAACGQGRHFENMDDLQSAVLAQLPAAGSVLVKGSRFMKMERVIEAMQASAPSKEDLSCC
jgi:UDP-N-acetylmuramoyl-tripeptide--D-alanyl-D-alanine ligase